MKSIKAIAPVFVIALVGCTSEDGKQTVRGSQGYSSVAKAESVSPIGISCEITSCVPISRGRGPGLEGKCEEKTLFYPGFIRGDINGDGQVTREDAMLAVKKLFDPTKFSCPRTADVGGYPQTEIPDGFFTSQDVFIWNNFKQSGQITWPDEVICGYDCEIPNHMQPQ